MAEQQNIRQDYNNATSGMNMDQSVNQIPKGKVTYSLNGTLENYDSNSFSYQNEEGNQFCLEFPEGYYLIGKYFIPERVKQLFFLSNPETGDSEIGYMDNNDCIYHTLVNAVCLNFNVKYPIHKVAHRITTCATEIFWTDGYNPRRYMDIDNYPKTLATGSDLCDPSYTNSLDCNQLKIQPTLSIPKISVVDVVSGGGLIAGTYQFAIQYSDVVGNPYTSYYSITNPTPIADPKFTTVNFNYPVGKSIILNVENLDTTGQFQYFNIAVIKTINDISSVELIGTYYIDNESKNITYSGQGKTDIRLAIADIFEKFPYYDIAGDVTAVQDVLVWSDLSSIDRVNYQHVANNISLKWETWRIPPTEDYADEINAANLRGYLRDEVYPFEIVFLLNNGKQTDGFHIPGREKNSWEIGIADIPDTNNDFTGDPDYTSGGVGYKAYWKIYNTGSVIGNSASFLTTPEYKGAYQYGEFAYWESDDVYPCNEDVWGELAGKPIRHHKFPDVLVSPIFESKSFSLSGEFLPEQGDVAIYPIGVKIDVNEIQTLINNSSLSSEQKADIIGFKIVRGDRVANKSVVAKGILRNVGKYKREGTEYLYPNYPYNDLSPDPFLNENNNAFSQLCDTYEINITSFGDGKTEAIVEYKSCDSNKTAKESYDILGIHEICSTERPVLLSPAEGTVGIATYEEWRVWNSGITGFYIKWNDPIEGEKRKWVEQTLGNIDQDPDNLTGHRIRVNVVIDSGGVIWDGGGWGSENNIETESMGIHSPQNSCNETDIPNSVTLSDKQRQIFNSPETSFGNPYLGNVLKLESVIFGGGDAHFTEVKDNSKYKLLTEAAQKRAIEVADELGKLSSDPDFDASAFFAAYEAQLAIYLNSISRKNYAYSFNSIADYNYTAPIANDLGIKQRDLELTNYLIPGVVNVGDDYNVNNYQRESSVFLKTDEDLLFPNETPSLNGAITEDSRFTISENDKCSTSSEIQDIKVVSYYASLKNELRNQWGQIYSYQTVDTGFQSDFTEQYSTVFGGDTFICRFAFKTKLPFFIDNRVNAPDDSDIFYDEIGNIGYPKYWHSSRSITKDFTVGGDPGYVLSNIISYKAHNFDCPNDESLDYYDGFFYLFAYGVPNFYCETSYNLDLRQAFNNKEGDFWPHVSTGIPDDWLQENFVSIANDNTYYYNPTFSKQNTENEFTHLPIDWDKPCYTHYPFRAIYSDPQNIDSDNRINSWLIYRALSYFDFPQNYGSLTSLDGIQNKAILARFENKSLLYGNLLTIDTSNPQAAYLGNTDMFKKAPPIDFAETDLGYMGSQHKLLLKIPQGQLSIDAKRGQVFLIQGTEAIDISAPGSGMNRFLTDHLPFEILNHFPDLNVDNHYSGVGLHAVYDAKYDRVIITKLDYVPLSDNIVYDEETGFYKEKDINNTTIRKPIFLTDTDYFCNRSFTLSYSLITKSWISFHSYLPNFYIAENNFFYSGMNGCCDDFDFIVGIPLAESGCIFDGTAYILIPPEPNCTLQGQAEVSYCELEGTAYSSTDCTLEGTALETEIPCVRPEDVRQYNFITGYDDVDSTINRDDACDVAAYLLTLEEGYTEVIHWIAVEATDLLIGNTMYANHGDPSCECIADGWYFTDESAFSNIVYHVENCILTEIVDCLATTTTTTTLFPPYCALDGEAQILEFPETCNYNGGTAYIVESTTTTTTSTLSITGICNYVRSESTGEVHAIGTGTGIVGDDQYGEIILPFTFQFYNTDYNSIFATTNGYLSFVDPTGASYENLELPYDNQYNFNGIQPMLFPFWTDLYVKTLTGHSISTITEGITPNRCFIIKYKLSTYDDKDDPLKIIEFEIRLYETSYDIEFVYGAGVEFAVAFYTIGIQELNGNFYDQFSYGTDSINEGTLIKYILDDCNNPGETTTTTTTVPVTTTSTTTTTIEECMTFNGFNCAGAVVMSVGAAKDAGVYIIGNSTITESSLYMEFGANYANGYGVYFDNSYIGTALWNGSYKVWLYIGGNSYGPYDYDWNTAQNGWVDVPSGTFNTNSITITSTFVIQLSIIDKDSNNLTALLTNFTSGDQIYITNCSENIPIFAIGTTTSTTTYEETTTTTTTEEITTTTTTTTVSESIIFTLSTTSTSATWSPQSVSKSGGTLTWNVTGAVTISTTVNDPTFDFSTPGTKDIVVTTPDGVAGLIILTLNNLQITLLDVTPSIALNALQCTNNLLTVLDVTPLTELITLYCHDNDISVLDVAELIKLQQLRCAGNNISILDVTDLVLLNELSCSFNNISVLDVALLTNLNLLWCDNNNISVLDVSLLTSLMSLICNDNNISVLDVTDLTILEDLICSNNSISVLDVATLPNILTITCSTNNISTLDTSTLSTLGMLYCNSNPISALDISSSIYLAELSFNGCSLSSISITNNDQLTHVSISENNLTKIVVDQVIDDLVTFNLAGSYFNAQLQDPAITPDAGKVASLSSIWTTVIV